MEMIVLNNHKYDTLACLAIDLGLPTPPFYTTKKELIDQLIRAISITKRDMNSVTEGILFDKKIKKLLFEHDEFFKLSTQEREYFWQTEFLKLQIKERESVGHGTSCGFHEQLVKDAPILIDGIEPLNGTQTPINDRFRPFDEIDLQSAPIANQLTNPRSRRNSRTQPVPDLEPLDDLSVAMTMAARAFTENPEQAIRTAQAIARPSRRNPRQREPDFEFIEDSEVTVREVDNLFEVVRESEDEDIDRQEIEEHERRSYVQTARNVNGMNMVPFDDIPPESMIDHESVFRTFDELED